MIIRYGLLLSGTSGQSTLDSILKLIGLLVLFIIIIICCYYVTKFVGTKQIKHNVGSNFQVIDTYRINQNKFLQLVKIGSKYVVIAIGKDNVTYITEINPDDVKLKESGVTKGNFKDVFAAIINKNKTEDSKQENS